MKLGMVINLKRCIGCNACTAACKQENNTDSGIFWSQVIATEKGVFPNSRIDYLPILCMHCQDAPCVRACPTRASQQADDGTVFIDTKKCMGCRYCMQACPYQARSFLFRDPAPVFRNGEFTPVEKARQGEHPRGTVEKCDFCAAKREAGLEPACVSTCPTKARVFGDLDDPNSEVSRLLRDNSHRRLKPELNTRPSVYYIGG